MAKETGHLPKQADRENKDYELRVIKFKGLEKYL